MPASSSQPGILPNPNVSALPVYRAGMKIDLARRLSGHDTIAALASTGNPYGCSPHVMEALSSSSFNPSRYSDAGCTELRNEISRFLEHPVDAIVVGNGSEGWWQPSCVLFWCRVHLFLP